MNAPGSILVATALLIPSAGGVIHAADELESVRLSDAGDGFVLTDSGTPFKPWGFNYDHNRGGALLEDYWVEQWESVVEDFHEMRDLGANTVRIHLQFGKFMTAADTPNGESLARLKMLLDLAEESGLYLDLTGLGCYHKPDVPAWYDALDETGRWAAQANFWTAIAETCAESPAVLCYDLMNEPVVPGGDQPRDDWLGPAFGDKYFVQFITLDRAGRDRADLARAWIHQLVTAIRRHDRRHLVTVGLVPWSLDRPGLTSGFIPQRIADELDFLCVHIYPERDKVDEALETLRGFDLGKPVIVEETFPLKCGADQLQQFIERGGSIADGWISFYWGQTVEEHRAAGTIGDAIIADWLERFPELMRDDDGR